MSNLAEPDNVSETNSNNSIPIVVIDDDRQKDYESEEDYESEDDENENDDESRDGEGNDEVTEPGTQQRAALHAGGRGTQLVALNLVLLDDNGNVSHSLCQ